MSPRLLPERFQDLDPFAATWALATEYERNRQSWVQPPQELKAFYDAMLARLDEVLNYLNQYSLADMPEDARRLLDMTKSLAEVTMSVELRRNSGSAKYFHHERFVPPTK